MLLFNILFIIFAGPQLSLQLLISIKLSRMNRLHAIKTIKYNRAENLEMFLYVLMYYPLLIKVGKFS